MNELISELTEQQKFSQGLREIADFYDEYPETKLPWEAQQVWYIFGAKKEEIASGARAFGSSNKKYDGDAFELVKTFPSGIRLGFYTNRSNVCERVEVGTEVIPAHVIPSKFEPEVFVEEKEVPKYEWRCGDSLLAGAQAVIAEIAEVLDDIPF